MATSKVKRATFFVNNNKIAAAESMDATFTRNGEQMHVQDGVDGISSGNVEAEFNLNTIRWLDLKAGEETLEAAFMSDADLEVDFYMGRNHYMCTAKIQSMKFNSESRTGMAKGAMTLKNASNIKRI
jgi:hypothetical protein